jgi:hypothetical protein
MSIVYQIKSQHAVEKENENEGQKAKEEKENK